MLHQQTTIKKVTFQSSRLKLHMEQMGVNWCHQVAFNKGENKPFCFKKNISNG